MKLRPSVLILALAAAGPAFAADDDGQARLRSIEGSVALQRPDEQGSDEARTNQPFLPGDRLWSDGGGRAEVQFADGSVLRLDRRGKLDYAEHDGRRSPAVVTLSLWSGSLFLHVPAERRRADYLIETPDGRVDIADGGRYRVDVDGRETRLLVFDGLAQLEGERTVRVEAGESSSVQRDEYPTRARSFDEWEVEDDFARWDAEQGDPLVWRADSQRYLPEDLAPYGGDFDRHGSWYYEVEIGYVWRPQVAVGWSPYRDGRWVWTAYGWTWLPNEPWGWAPFHYGRWGHSSAHGWYWIPGRRWSPAWVSWRTTPGHVGWCALGHRDQPVGRGLDRGHAVPRGRSAGAGHEDGWMFVPRGDLRAHDLAARRVRLSAPEVESATPLEGARQRLGRDLRMIDATEAPRGGRARPTPGDSVPELRGDQLTTIPAPAARRRPLDEPRFRGDDGAAARPRNGLPAAQDPHSARPRDQGREGLRPPSVESQRRRLPERRDDTGTSPARENGERARPRRPAVEDQSLRLPDDAERRSPRREPAARSDQPAERPTPPAERDVLRRFFGSLGGSRDRSRGNDRSGDEARPRERSRDEGARDNGDRSRSGDGWRAPERAPRSTSPRQAAPRQEAPRRQPTQAQDKAQPRPPRDRDR